MNEEKGRMPFTKEYQELIRVSREVALSLGNAFITSNHMLLSLLQVGNTKIHSALASLGVPVDEVRTNITEACRAKGAGHEIELGNVPLTTEAEAVLKESVTEFARRQGPAIGTEHFLLAVARQSDSDAAKALAPFGFAYDRVEKALEL